MVLNAWNSQPRKQLFSLTSAVRITLLSWNIGQGEENVDGDAAQSARAHAGKRLRPGQSVQDLHLVALSHHHLPNYFPEVLDVKTTAQAKNYLADLCFSVSVCGWMT